MALDLTSERRMITAPEALKRAENRALSIGARGCGRQRVCCPRQLGLTRAKLEYRLKKIGLLTGTSEP